MLSRIDLVDFLTVSILIDFFLSLDYHEEPLLNKKSQL